ncbi:unnamed protein product, partial [Mesorhabditis belari]|uniref:Uncharacterized protein n=1 Tax=Mesorhabditis belari TaxID=2138241 RepID=A0AAF3EVY8_9BILA
MEMYLADDYPSSETPKTELITDPRFLPDDERTFPAISMGSAMLGITMAGFVCIIFYIFIKFGQENRAEKRWGSPKTSKPKPFVVEEVQSAPASICSLKLIDEQPEVV